MCVCVRVCVCVCVCIQGSVDLYTGTAHHTSAMYIVTSSGRDTPPSTHTQRECSILLSPDIPLVRDISYCIFTLDSTSIVRREQGTNWQLFHKLKPIYNMLLLAFKSDNWLSINICTYKCTVA